MKFPRIYRTGDRTRLETVSLLFVGFMLVVGVLVIVAVVVGMFLWAG